MKIIIDDALNNDQNITLIKYGLDKVMVFNTIKDEKHSLVIINLDSLRNSIQCLIESNEKSFSME